MANILFFSAFTEHTSHNRNARRALRGLRPCRDWKGLFDGADTRKPMTFSGKDGAN